jgi:hypothetical protein
MSSRKPTAIALALTLIATLAAPAIQVAAWTGTLPDGAEIRVDPNTHKATRVDGDSAVQLWDGVHRMADGSVVIVRDGTVVPNPAMLQTWEGSAPQEETLVGRPCELLELRACGADNACAGAPDCLAARRLRNAEREEQRRAPLSAGAPPATAIGNRCGAELANPALIQCAAAQAPESGPSPCAILVERVCGADGRCAAAPACPPARQLQAQDRTERAARDPVGPTPSGEQCREALGNAFFAPCR